MGDGFAAAHIAVYNGDERCLRMCLNLGADSETRNYKSETPMQMAYVKYGCDKHHPMVS
jgi:ankyrin repeat protein